ncbi:MAG: MBL fold metallo-hydrolase [Planctomycetes bacterium]|nr:MBL fold metallo-hydrolase [Planctomycetota bacterium]
MKLTFLGAAGTVTGSKYLLEADGTRVLVDCGLFQGVKNLRERNWKPLGVDPKDLDAVLLTHAHIDHSGYLPVLVRDGFAGKIHCTPPTRDLCAILLPDSGHIQEEDARYANKKGFSKHRPAKPLYTSVDGERALSAFAPVELERSFAVGALQVTLRSAGHILGAASIQVEHRGTSILFSGDLGRDDDLLMPPPTRPQSPDWVVIESTYGNRQHPQVDPLSALEQAVRPCLERGGIALLPAFAVGRAQLLLYCFERLFAHERLPRVPVFLNSPMATSATALYQQHVAYHRLDPRQCADVCDLATFVRSVEDSKALNRRAGPMVVISASGMLTGGRVLHHLAAYGPGRKNAILLPGYQPPGTRGHSLLEGARSLKVHGARVAINAEVAQLDVFSAHADQGGLLGWLGACERPPRGVFVTHGEPASADALRLEIKDQLAYRARVPELGDQVELD